MNKFDERLSTALDSKLKQGRPPKYCRMCQRELRKRIGRQLERVIRKEICEGNKYNSKDVIK